MTSQPVRGLMAEVGAMLITATAAKIAEQLIIARQQRINEKEENNVQLHSESEQAAEPTGKDSGLRIISN
mgnify:CR=1 FL=1